VAPPGVGIRAAAPGELPGIGQLRVAAYRASGFLGPASGYTAELAALGADGRADVLVAVRAGEIVGTVAVQVPPQPCEIAVSEDEHEVRALAVLPQARGLGVGGALLRAVIGNAARRRARRVVLCTLPQMRTAQRLYSAAGFRRLPGRDSEPVPGIVLLAYALVLPAAAGGADPAGTPAGG
jgi:ribosomal protein S18 acetylase RimI-like enzyme